jgi:transposase InsO family protein
MEFEAGEGVGKAALRAGMHRNTARRLLGSGRGPGEPRPARGYRTRPDPFEEDWPGLGARLEEAPGLQARTLLGDLIERDPGRYGWGHLRTLQRRVKRWRAAQGPERELFFAQEHRPGEALQVDFTWASELQITIHGSPYPHMLCHVVLPYSNWGWATPCRSESMAALSEGLQTALWRLGGVPEWSQSDNSTAATHDLRSRKRAFNADYLALVGHYGLRARTTGVGKKEQNGDVESLNGVLKRDLEQQLLLRGSREFESQEDYRAWLASALERRNATRERRLEEERALLRPLPATRLACYAEFAVRVGQGSTIRVKGHPYSVPSRLKGERVRVRVHETRVEVLYEGKVELDVERLVGREGAKIQYRHVIHSLVRKPGAFRNYRYREALFPTETFRRAHERLAKERSAWGADAEYLRIVELAAKTLEADVEAALTALLAADQVPSFERVRERVCPPAPTPALPVPHVDLTGYDDLLEAPTLVRAAS